ncbi:hypothetical protein KUT97_30590, partial [Pseudomonas aeruginosa]|nr:hypothetical protein [Pseudomonas aeruginosa]
MQFKLKTLQLLAFLSISQAATAEIYWHGVGTEDKKIKTPSELCNYYAEQRKMDSYERPGAGGQIAITEIRRRPQKLSATPDHFGKVLPHVLSRTQR